MRPLLYDLLTTDTDLQSDLGGASDILNRVLPRRSRENILVVRPFLVFGLGNATSEALVDSTANDPVDKDGERQFFQVWVHDDSESYALIDNIVEKVKRRLIGVSSTEHRVLTIAYLETSAEFNNETYNTLFRYIRFQAIKTQERTS